MHSHNEPDQCSICHAGLGSLRPPLVQDDPLTGDGKLWSAGGLASVVNHTFIRVFWAIKCTKLVGQRFAQTPHGELTVLHQDPPSWCRVVLIPLSPRIPPRSWPCWPQVSAIWAEMTPTLLFFWQIEHCTWLVIKHKQNRYILMLCIRQQKNRA